MEEKNDAVITVSDMPEIKEAEDAFCNITLIQWNLHIGIDMTGRYNLKRQAEVLNELDADVIALNEVDRNCIRTGFSDMTKELGILTGMMFTQFCAARVLPPGWVIWKRCSFPLQNGSDRCLVNSCHQR